jgi:hypothetical protein
MSFSRQFSIVPAYTFSDVKCDWCGQPVKMVAESQEPYRYLQPEDGLVIEVSGGYGMAYDPLGSEENSTLLCCKNCIPQLCQYNPPIKKLLES